MKLTTMLSRQQVEIEATGNIGPKMCQDQNVSNIGRRFYSISLNSLITKQKLYTTNKKS